MRGKFVCPSRSVSLQQLPHLWGWKAKACWLTVLYVRWLLLWKSSLYNISSKVTSCAERQYGPFILPRLQEVVIFPCAELQYLSLPRQQAQYKMSNDLVVFLFSASFFSLQGSGSSTHNKSQSLQVRSKVWRLWEVCSLWGICICSGEDRGSRQGNDEEDEWELAHTLSQQAQCDLIPVFC